MTKSLELWASVNQKKPYLVGQAPNYTLGFFFLPFLPKSLGGSDDEEDEKKQIKGRSFCSSSLSPRPTTTTQRRMSSEDSFPGGPPTASATDDAAALQTVFSQRLRHGFSLVATLPAVRSRVVPAPAPHPVPCVRVKSFALTCCERRDGSVVHVSFVYSRST